jgi:hypothetical protein
VTRSGLKLGSRLVLIVLLGTIGTVAAPRPARAMGCHAPERPALGLSFSWERTRSAELIPIRPDRPEPRAFVPLPCSGDVPGSFPRGLVSRVAATSVSFVLERVPAGQLVLEEPVPAPSIPVTSRLDRPPRPSPTAI